MMTQTRQLDFLPDRRRASRRPATVLILVMTILAILFVTGVAFMATMSFEFEMVRNEKETADTGPAMDDILESVEDFVSIGVEQVIDAATGNSVVEQPDTALSALSGIPFAEAPGVMNTLSPVAPFVEKKNSISPSKVLWAWFTDAEALSGTATNYITNMQLDTALSSGVKPPTGYLTPVDADGDGIVDANQVSLERLGFKRRQIDGLARLLNPESNPKGDVYLGLRVVPHGGMVNLSDSHPLLIRELFSMAPDADLPEVATNFEHYSPEIEEAALRRRGGLLPPRDVPPSQILGSPMDPNPDTGGADFPELYWPGESVQDHRYWPFLPDEENTSVGDGPLWQVRMNPESTTYSRDQYDRRHLVTSISYGDNLRRATVVQPATVGEPKMDLVDLIVEKKGASAPNDFPYVNYPDSVQNIYTGDDIDFDTLNWNACVGDANCKINPRKGRLRLSMDELDKIWARPLGGKDLAKRLIQDAFTLMLLNARGDEFGLYLPPSPLGSGTREWQSESPEYTAVSEAAAMLTANMIDFMDYDDEPTDVDVRSADYKDLTMFGQPTGQVIYGLENQPYITEAASEVTTVGQAVPETDSYAVELFNPYDVPIYLDSFSLQFVSTGTGGGSVQLSGVLNPLEFEAFVWGANFSGTPAADALDFAQGTIIKLLRTIKSTGKVIVVDEFDLIDSGVGTQDGNKYSRQRLATTGMKDRWYAVVPYAVEQTSPTLGSGFPGRLTDFADWPPVEAVIANAPNDRFAEAFPTTGSLLLLMRYANSEGVPFNRFLSGKVDDVYPIDNGRMPVYDVEGLHRVPADKDPTETYKGPPADNGIVGTSKSTKDHSGTVEHLPWGQLVFDYFTALPLKNDGPFPGYTSTSLADNQPRVDMDGLRVHGRININAAPWFVLKGLPFIPMKLVPQAFQDTFRKTLLLLPAEDAEAQPIGPARAKAIVAYRDQREIKQGLGTTFTGNYGDTAGGAAFSREWGVGNPAVRRGMGFLTVGELANVRHPSAVGNTEGYPRLDDGVVPYKPGYGDTYLKAIAALACLSDWVSVRSQVFTVYGTLRGDIDDTIEDSDPVKEEALRRKDVDSRAVRFQQTIDRLPTFLGADEPSLIGNRVIASYTDVRND